MIRVRIERGDGHMALIVDGHSGTAARGNDVVCAGVSAIMETAGLGLRAIEAQYPEAVRVQTSEDTVYACPRCDDEYDTPGEADACIERHKEVSQLKG